MTEEFIKHLDAIALSNGEETNPLIYEGLLYFQQLQKNNEDISPLIPLLTETISHYKSYKDKPLAVQILVEYALRQNNKKLIHDFLKQYLTNVEGFNAFLNDYATKGEYLDKLMPELELIYSMYPFHNAEYFIKNFLIQTKSEASRERVFQYVLNSPSLQFNKPNLIGEYLLLHKKDIPSCIPMLKKWLTIPEFFVAACNLLFYVPDQYLSEFQELIPVLFEHKEECHSSGRSYSFLIRYAVLMPDKELLMRLIPFDSNGYSKFIYDALELLRTISPDKINEIIQFQLDWYIQQRKSNFQFLQYVSKSVKSGFELSARQLEQLFILFEWTYYKNEVITIWLEMSKKSERQMTQVLTEAARYISIPGVESLIHHITTNGAENCPFCSKLQIVNSYTSQDLIPKEREVYLLKVDEVVDGNPLFVCKECQTLYSYRHEVVQDGRDYWENNDLNKISPFYLKKKNSSYLQRNPELLSNDRFERLTRYLYYPVFEVRITSLQLLGEYYIYYRKFNELKQLLDSIFWCDQYFLTNVITAHPLHLDFFTEEELLSNVKNDQSPYQQISLSLYTTFCISRNEEDRMAALLASLSLTQTVYVLGILTFKDSLSEKLLSAIEKVFDWVIPELKVENYHSLNSTLFRNDFKSRNHIIQFVYKLFDSGEQLLFCLSYFQNNHLNCPLTDKQLDKVIACLQDLRYKKEAFALLVKMQDSLSYSQFLEMIRINKENEFLELTYFPFNFQKKSSEFISEEKFQQEIIGFIKEFPYKNKQALYAFAQQMALEGKSVERIIQTALEVGSHWSPLIYNSIFLARFYSDYHHRREIVESTYTERMNPWESNSVAFGIMELHKRKFDISFLLELTMRLLFHPCSRTRKNALAAMKACLDTGTITKEETLMRLKKLEHLPFAKRSEVEAALQAL